MGGRHQGVVGEIRHILPQVEIKRAVPILEGLNPTSDKLCAVSISYQVGPANNPEEICVHCLDCYDVYFSSIPRSSVSITY